MTTTASGLIQLPLNYALYKRLAGYVLSVWVVIFFLGLSEAGAASLIGPWVGDVEVGTELIQLPRTPHVRQPNNEYRETQLDLRVNAVGGPIDIARSWSRGRWWLNAAWGPLSFELDPLGEEAIPST